MAKLAGLFEATKLKPIIIPQPILLGFSTILKKNEPSPSV
jgi:hypothetical protein